MYVWPGHPYMERDLLNAGLSILTDYPDLQWSYLAVARGWMRPATMPLSDEQWLELERGIIPDDVAPWHEISNEQLGWKAVRMIGHRGCGKTSRPVIQST